ncbi:MAG TPA: hypothetical protein VFU47_07890 [Armatimonadota bacterium]|nr:hypothetical protein [Armatimonadota bacterium]
MTTGRLDTCQSCGAEILWVMNVRSGNPNPLDVEPLDEEIGVGIVAYNPRNGNGYTLRQEDVDDRVGRLRDWAAKGVTFHRNHFMTCPDRERFRGYHRNQP